MKEFGIWAKITTHSLSSRNGILAPLVLKYDLLLRNKILQMFHNYILGCRDSLHIYACDRFYFETH